MQFKIKLKGELGKEWTGWFENLDIDFDGKDTVLSGHIEDQSALHGILNRLRDLNLTLISVNPEFEDWQE